MTKNMFEDAIALQESIKETSEILEKFDVFDEDALGTNALEGMLVVIFGNQSSYSKEEINKAIRYGEIVHSALEERYLRLTDKFDSYFDNEKQPVFQSDKKEE